MKPWHHPRGLEKTGPANLNKRPRNHKPTRHCGEYCFLHELVEDHDTVRCNDRIVGRPQASTGGCPRTPSTHSVAGHRYLHEIPAVRSLVSSEWVFSDDGSTPRDAPLLTLLRKKSNRHANSLMCPVLNPDGAWISTYNDPPPFRVLSRVKAA